MPYEKDIIYESITCRFREDHERTGQACNGVVPSKQAIMTVQQSWLAVKACSGSYQDCNRMVYNNE